MLNKLPPCRNCVLEQIGKGFSIPEGTGRNGVLIIGEALGTNEVFYGTPFVKSAESGSCLEDVFRRLKVQRDDFVLWNVVACFEYSTLVLLPDGTKKTIGNLVENNYEGNVLSFDITANKFISKRVTKVHKNRRLGRQLYKVSYEDAKKNSKGKVGAIATQDHKFLTKNGWIEAQKLKGEYINVGNYGYDTKAESTILGTILGDAHINFNTACLTLTHSIEQLEWLKCKARILGIENNIVIFNSNDKKYCRICTEANPYFRKLGKIFYNSINKSVPSSIIDKLDIQALATLYIDDGYIQVRKIRKPNISIATCNFTIEDIKVIQQAFLNFNIVTKIRESFGSFKKEKVYYRLTLDVENTDKFIKLIGKYVPFTMRYKLGDIDCESYDSSNWDYQERVPFYSKAIVEEYNKWDKNGTEKPNWVYCLTVEDTNNFVTLGGVVHNCQPPYNLLEGEEYEELACNHCKVYMDEVIKFYKPKVIVAAGKIPLKYLTNFNGTEKQSITMLRGYKVEGSRYPEIPVVPTLHPSYVNRGGRKLTGVLRRDIQFALDIANNKVEKFEYDYNVNPTYQELYNFYLSCKLDSNKIISYDIETPFTKEGTEEFEYAKGSEEITQIQFSTKKGEAIVVDTKTVGILDYNETDELFHLNKDNKFYKLIKSILELPNLKLGWNCFDFDAPILAKNGITVNNELDLMWVYHHLNPDIVGNNGMALGFAANLFAPELPAWKHLIGEDILYYGGLDVDSLSRIYPSITNIMKAFPKFNNESKTLWEGVTDDVIKLWPILKDISRRGMPMNREYRAVFVEEVKQKIEETTLYLRENYPEELRNRRPEEGFKNPPSELRESIDEFEKSISYIGDDLFNNNNNSLYLFRDNDSKMQFKNKFIEEKTRRTYKAGETEREYSGLVIREFDINGIKQKRYCRLEEFNPRSREQVIEFIKWVGDEVPKTGKKGVYRESTGKDKIYDLWLKTGDPFYKAIIFIRELEKLLDTYIGDGVKKGWIISEDGRVHSKLTSLPATGQLSSSKDEDVGANIQNAPKYGGMYSTPEYKQLAIKFRNCIQPNPNHTLFEADYKSFHALTIGVESEDENYIRMVRNDIHSFVAAHILSNKLPPIFEKLNKKGKNTFEELKELYIIDQTLFMLRDLENWPNLPDKQLSDKLKWIKNNHDFVRNRMAKPAILGIGFGMTINKFFALYKESFKTMKDAQLVYDILFKLFPNLFIFQNHICELADSQSYLVSRYGYIRWFYHVYDRKRLDKYVEPKFGESITKDKFGNFWLKTPKGSDAKEAIAFLPANHAFGKIKEAMRELNDLGLLEKYRLINQIHDSLLFECPNEYLDECLEVVPRIMELPSKVIKNKTCPEGLICQVESSISNTGWGEMKQI